MRFKCKENPDKITSLWSRVAIVVDSELPDLKYLIEVNEKGI